MWSENRKKTMQPYFCK